MTYQLVRDFISQDTTEAFTELAALASAGEIQGAAFICLLKGRRFVVNVCGTAHRNATLARGCLMVLDDHLAELIHGRDPDETR